MAGKPYKVGRFAHTLRIRLMREHLGIDVDSLDQDDLMANDPIQPEHMASTWATLTKLMERTTKSRILGGVDIRQIPFFRIL